MVITMLVPSPSFLSGTVPRSIMQKDPSNKSLSVTGAQRHVLSFLSGHSLVGEGTQQMLSVMTRGGHGYYGSTEEGTQLTLGVLGLKRWVLKRG